MENQINIRAYAQEDFERLCEIHDPARKRELALAGLSEAFLPLTVAAEREGLFDYQLYVAEYGGLVAGFVAFTPDELAWLYVEPSHTRLGIGTRLMDFALRHMEGDVTMEVLVGNTPALALYKTFGFTVSETVTGVMPGNETFPVTVYVLRRGAIRPLQPRDTQQVMEIWLHGNLDAHPFIPGAYWESNFQMVQEQLLGAEAYVYEQNGEIRGFIGMMDGYIAGIFVDKRHRSLGVGKALLNYAKENWPGLSLNVYRENRRAVKFYQREGFSISREGVDEATGAAEYTMTWSAAIPSDTF